LRQQFIRARCGGLHGVIALDAGNDLVAHFIQRLERFGEILFDA